MRQFFENKLTFLAVSSLFTLAFCWNLGHQRTDMMNGHGLLVPEGAINVAHGAAFPPDPWEDPAVRLAHGATFPPDPWEDPAVRLAHGATFPPDPWEDPAVRLAHGATFPPDPWEDPAVHAAMFAA